MKSITSLLFLATGFVLSALDVPLPTSTGHGWMRADVRAQLPATVVLAAPPEATRAGVAFEVLPGPSCARAVTSLHGRYRVLLDGQPLAAGEVPEACWDPQVHRVEVRA